MSEWAAPPEISSSEYLALSHFVFQKIGLDLRDGKQRLVSARLGKYVRGGGFRNFGAYLRYVQADSTGDSLTALIDALTTNHTSFLREPEHFRFLVSEAAPALQGRRSVCIWSAASSTGEEPYSVLFSLLDAMNGSAVAPQVRILATDISTRVLAIAREGIYPAEKLKSVPAAWIQKYFRPAERHPAEYQVCPEFRAMVEFQRFNLMDTVRGVRLYPIIFCRNVMIYFNKQTQAEVVRKLAGALEPGGLLMVGHSESLTGLDHPLQYVRPAVYRKG